MTFFEEYKKFLVCLILVLILLLLQLTLGYNFDEEIRFVIWGAIGILGINSVRYSVLTTSERETLNRLNR